jgi:hypothetical protein
VLTKWEKILEKGHKSLGNGTFEKMRNRTPHSLLRRLTTSYFKATILPAFLFLFIFGDAEKEDKAEGKVCRRE